MLPGAVPRGLGGWNSRRGESVHQGERQAEGAACREPALLSPPLSGRAAENQANEGKGAGEFAVHLWLWTRGFPVTVGVGKGCLELLCATPESNFVTQSLSSKIQSCLPFGHILLK